MVFTKFFYHILFDACLNREVSILKAFVRMYKTLIYHLSKVIRSKLHLVDLAGSERVHKTSSTGQVYIFELYISSIYICHSHFRLDHVFQILNEAKFINTSVSQSTEVGWL